jgi:hypothetical protein
MTGSRAFDGIAGDALACQVPEVTATEISPVSPV